jgi:transposase
MVDYEKALDQTVTIRDVLPPDHLARFIARVVLLLDLSAIYAQYAPVGGEAYAPELLLGLLFYGYATGVFSSRKIEKATYESIPFRFLAGGWHPDHDTIANFRKTFLPEIRNLFAQVLVIAHELGVLKLGTISVDGSKVHADASKSQAVSYGRLLQMERRLGAEVEELIALGETAEQEGLPKAWISNSRFLCEKSDCSTWNRPKRSWKHGLRNGTRWKKPSMRPSCGNGKRKPGGQGENLVVGRPNHPQPDLGRRTSTTLPILTHGS